MEKVEELIRQYIHTIMELDCIDVEIIEDTVVLSREGRWHIYLSPFTMIGCFVDDDIVIADLLRKNREQIQYIYDMFKEEQGDAPVQ